VIFDWLEATNSDTRKPTTRAGSIRFGDSRWDYAYPVLTPRYPTCCRVGNRARVDDTHILPPRDEALQKALRRCQRVAQVSLTRQEHGLWQGHANRSGEYISAKQPSVKHAWAYRHQDAHCVLEVRLWITATGKDVFRREWSERTTAKEDHALNEIRKDLALE
jgi:hypothetical protein